MAAIRSRVRARRGGAGFFGRGGLCGRRSKTGAAEGVWVPSAGLDDRAGRASVTRRSVHRKLHEAHQIRFWSNPYRGRLVRPVSLAMRMRSSQRARRRCRSSRSGSCPREVLVANAVNRSPSRSVNRNCAPGCGRSLRTMTRIPGDQSRQIDHTGDLGDPRAVTHPAIAVVGRCPRLPRGSGRSRRRWCRSGRTRLSTTTGLRDIVDEVVGSAGGIGAYQDRVPDPIPMGR